MKPKTRRRIDETGRRRQARDADYRSFLGVAVGQPLPSKAGQIGGPPPAAVAVHRGA